MDKRLEKDSAPPISSKEYNTFFVRQAFEEGSILQPMKDLIDKRFEKFFVKWHRLSVGENKKALQKKKLMLQEIFYTVFYQSIIHDSELLNELKKVIDIKKESKKTIVQIMIIRHVNDRCKVIIDEVFAMPSLVLSAFETTTKNFEKKLKRNLIKDGSEIDTHYKEIINLVHKGETLYKATLTINEKNNTNYEKNSVKSYCKSRGISLKKL